MAEKRLEAIFLPSITHNEQRGRGKEKLIRLTTRDRMLTTSVGDVLPEQPDPGKFEKTLDVSCGSGYRVIEAALASPDMALTGP